MAASSLSQQKGQSSILSEASLVAGASMFLSRRSQFPAWSNRAVGFALIIPYTAESHSCGNHRILIQPCPEWRVPCPSSSYSCPALTSLLPAEASLTVGLMSGSLHSQMGTAGGCRRGKPSPWSSTHHPCPGSEGQTRLQRPCLEGLSGLGELPGANCLLN